MFDSSSAFVRGLILTLLLLCHALSIVLSSLPFHFHGGSLYEVLQIIFDGVPLLLNIGLFYYVFAEHSRPSLVLEITGYGVMYLIGLAASIALTIHRHNGQLAKDYRNVPDAYTFGIVLLALTWICTALAFVGFLVACVNVWSHPPKPVTKAIISKPKVRPGSLPIQTPPPDDGYFTENPWNHRVGSRPAQDQPVIYPLPIHQQFKTPPM